jgi:hypothetical protein
LKLKEDKEKCKDFTRPTFSEVLNNKHLKVSQSTRSVHRKNLFQVLKLRRNSAFAHRVPTERNNRLRHFKVKANDKLRRDSTTMCKDHARSAEVAKPFESFRVNKAQEGKHFNNARRDPKELCSQEKNRRSIP